MEMFLGFLTVLLALGGIGWGLQKVYERIGGMVADVQNLKGRVGNLERKVEQLS